MCGRRALVEQPNRVVASADAWVLDRSGAWIDLPGAIVASAPDAWLVDLSGQRPHASA